MPLLDPMTIMLVLCVLLPLAVLLAFCLPVYLGIWAGLYCVYEARGKPNPMPALKYDLSAVLERFSAHWHYWQHSDTITFSGFTFPFLGPVALGLVCGLCFFFLAIRAVRDIFRVTD